MGPKRKRSSGDEQSEQSRAPPSFVVPSLPQRASEEDQPVIPRDGFGVNNYLPANVHYAYSGVRAEGQARSHFGNNFYEGTVNNHHHHDGSTSVKDPKAMEEQGFVAMVESLRFDQMESRYQTIQSAGESCRWLRNEPIFRDWRDDSRQCDHHGFLWIKGKPGAGKSILMKYAFDSAESSEDRLNVSFFFNARGDLLEKSVEGMYRDLLYQLFTALLERWASLSAAERLEKLKHVFGIRPRQVAKNWPLELLQSILSTAVSNLGDYCLTCYIDALDECNEDDVRDMVTYFEDLGDTAMRTGCRFYVCFSSRHYPRISLRHGLELILEAHSGHQRDIAQYVHSKLKVSRPDINHELRTAIERRASGIFLWVFLVVRILNKEYDSGNVHNLRRRLDDIPDGLDALFTDILHRGPKNMKRLTLTLQWVLYARRPLQPEELYYAIMTGVELSRVKAWDRDKVTAADIERYILDSSKGLAELTVGITPTVQFIHESVRDYLRDTGLKRLMPDLGGNLHGISHDRLKICCRDYLGVVRPEFRKGFVEEGQLTDSAANLDHEFAGWTRFDPPYRLASAVDDRRFTVGSSLPEGNLTSSPPRSPSADFGWSTVKGYYTPSPPRSPAVFADGDTFDDPLPVSDRSTTENSDSYSLTRPWVPFWEDPDYEPYDGIPGVPPAAWVNVKPAPRPVNSLRSLREEFPFLDYAMLLFEHAEAAQMAGILQQQFIERFPLYDWVMLLIAANLKPHYIHGEIMGNIRPRYSSKVTMKYVLVGESCLRLLRLEVSLNPGFTMEDEEYGSCLGLAVVKGQKSMVELLLRSGAKDDIGCLAMAYERGYDEIFKLLVTFGGEPDLYEYAAAPVMHSACEEGDVGTVRVLLTIGAKVNVEGGRFGHPLQAASYFGFDDIVALLLDHGADCNAYAGEYGYALQAAARSGHQVIVRRLLRQGADPSADGGKFGSALQAASANGHAETVSLLIQHGANVSAPGGPHDGALQAASRLGHETVVRRLLESGADSNARGGEFGPALQSAAHFGHTGIVKLLLEHGADCNAQGGYFGNALQAAATTSKVEIVQLLLDYGGQVNAVGGMHGTPLSAARYNGRNEVIDLLLSAGAR